MGKVIVMQPVLPQLTVEKVDEDNIKEFGDFLRAHNELFPALKHVATYAMRQRKQMVYLADRGGRVSEDSDVIFKIGDYLVISENGFRHFTDKPYIRHGLVNDLPAELFLPIEAKIVP